MPPFIRRRLQRAAHVSEKSGPRFSLRLHAPMLIFGGIVLLLTLGWSFFVGFLVGRGENPGEKLAQYDPFTSQTKIVDEKAQSPVVAEKKPEEQVQEKEPGVVEQAAAVEEQKGAQGSGVEPKQTEAPKQTPPHPFSRPSETSLAAWGETRTPNAAKPVEGKESRAGGASESTKEARFDFAYRVATFTRRPEAEALEKKLKPSGARVELIQKGNLFLIYVKKRCTEAEDEKLRAFLAGLRVKDPLLLSKKPAGSR